MCKRDTGVAFDRLKLVENCDISARSNVIVCQTHPASTSRWSTPGEAKVKFPGSKGFEIISKLQVLGQRKTTRNKLAEMRDKIG